MKKIEHILFIKVKQKIDKTPQKKFMYKNKEHLKIAHTANDSNLLAKFVFFLVLI